MAEVRFEDLNGSDILAAPQDPGTHAMVQNPFAWSEEN
ncbi:streptamidine-related RiPP repeat protein [Psychromicrobium sp. YIM B11713]